MGNSFAPIDVTTPLNDNEIAAFIKAIRGEDTTNIPIKSLKKYINYITADK